MIQSSVLNFNYSMLLGRPWLRDVKMSHDWSNTIIIIQRTNIIKTIPITKKLEVPTKHLEMFVCYAFHFGIFDEEKDLTFARKPWLFSIGTIVVLILARLEQHVNLITLASLNLVEQIYVHVEHVYVLLVLSYIHVEPIFVLPISSYIHVDTMYVLHV